jgi:hypothetical protein
MNNKENQTVSAQVRDEFYLSVALFGLLAVGLIALVPPA